MFECYILLLPQNNESFCFVKKKNMLHVKEKINEKKEEGELNNNAVHQMLTICFNKMEGRKVDRKIKKWKRQRKMNKRNMVGWFL